MRDDHSTDDCSRPAPLDSAALNELVETGLAQHAEHGGNVTMRPGALDLERLFDRLLDARTLQQCADRLDQRRWQVREIGERALLDLLPLAVALADEDSRRRVSIWDAFDEHAPNQKLICAKKQVAYMDTFVAPESHQTPAAPGVQSNFE
jgi:hypothetical protein